MTYREYASSSTVDELLVDAGHSEVPELRLALLRVQALAKLPAPAPNAELSAMLAGSPDTLAQKRQLRKHRPTVVGVAVIAGMGLGVTGVAATSPSPRLGEGGATIKQLTGGWAPFWTLPIGPANNPAASPQAGPGPNTGSDGTGFSDSAPARAEASSGAENAGSSTPASGINKAPFPLPERAAIAGRVAVVGQAAVAGVAVAGVAVAGVAANDPLPGKALLEAGATAGLQSPVPRVAAEQLQHVARHLADSVARGHQGGRHVAETSPRSKGSALESAGSWLQKFRR